MYFLGFSLEEITHQFPVSVKTLRFYVFGVSDDGQDPLCWYKQKKEVDKTGVMPYIRGKVDALEKATGMAYRLLTRGLEGVAERVDSGAALEGNFQTDLHIILNNLSKEDICQLLMM